jgi:hypothetical protein
MQLRTLRTDLAHHRLRALAATVLGLFAVVAFARAEGPRHVLEASCSQEDRAPADRDPPREDRGRAPRAGGGRRGLPPDWPRAGGFGPAGDRTAIEGMVLDGLREPGRELAEENLAAVIEVARDISPEWGEMLSERAARDERQLRSALGARARRLVALAALREHAPAVYGAKIAEFRAQARTERAATALVQAESDGSDEDALAAARAALDEAARVQAEATLAARRVELEALEARIARYRADLDEDARDLDLAVATLADEAKARMRRATEARPGPRE